ncbi:MAG TPA: hypothetical protein DCL77_18720 [Prolixibacteraceae bacterium]|jgi:hypothetical protein|nr:hypothetical protein [Prolixibacteraceae bacterium]
MLCVLGTAFAGFSQDKNFDLSKYKFPDYKRHELELNFNSSGVMDKDSRDVPSSSMMGGTERIDYSDASFNSGASLTYQYDYLTRKQVDFLYSTFSGQYDFSKSNADGQKTKRFNPHMNWYLTGFRRYYLKENKFFIEGLTDLQYYLDNYKTTYTNGSDYQNRTDRLDLSIGLGLGIGRIEKVSDLWQASYILEKLNGQKSLDRDLQQKDIYEFAYLASKLKNKRFFDARLRKIAELQALDSLMHNQGLVKNSDISYFTTLNDYWSYGNFQDRESGKELKVSAKPQYTRQYSKADGDTANISSKTSIISNISFKCAKPINLYWERYFNASVSNETIIEKSGEYYNNYPKNSLSGGANFGYGYFPDSRTSFSGILGYSGQKLMVQNSTGYEPNVSDQWMNMVYLQLKGNYYISPQLQITANFNVNYIDKAYRTINEIRTSYDLGLRYAIF